MLLFICTTDNTRLITCSYLLYFKHRKSINYDFKSVFEYSFVLYQSSLFFILEYVNDSHRLTEISKQYTSNYKLILFTNFSFSLAHLFIDT